MHEQVIGMASEETRTNDTDDPLADEGLLKYVRILKDNDVKVTSQRVRILEYLDLSQGHVDAETLHKVLRRENPSLSKTTVYNNLELFRKKGLVSVLTISGTERWYEMERGMHHHLLCDGCGRIYNIDISCPYLGGMLHGEHKIKEVHGYFRGTCSTCLSAGTVEEDKED